jgi:hypothetical protein
MLIRMLSTAPGSVDGIRVAQYEAGLEYDLTATAGSRDLAEAFVGADLAEEVGTKSAPPVDTELAGVDASEASLTGVVDAPTPAKPGRKPKAQ